MSLDEELDALAVRLADAQVARSQERWLRELEACVRELAVAYGIPLDEEEDE